MFYQNIQGLSKNKFDDYLQEVFYSNYDLVCFSETWLKTTECSQYEVPNYKCVNKPRSFLHNIAKRGAGGMLLYFHNRFSENVKK